MFYITFFLFWTSVVTKLKGPIQLSTHRSSPMTHRSIRMVNEKSYGYSDWYFINIEQFWKFWIKRFEFKIWRGNRTMTGELFFSSQRHEEIASLILHEQFKHREVEQNSRVALARFSIFLIGSSSSFFIHWWRSRWCS